MMKGDNKMERMMTMECFGKMVKEALEKQVGSDCSVAIREVEKNNGVKWTGISVTKPNTNISPTVYLESFLRQYNEGESFEEILKKIVESALPTEQPMFDLGEFTDWQRAKEKVCFKLVNRELNKKMLEEVPHVPVMDLEMVFYFKVGSSFAEGVASITIHNTHLSAWNISEAELQKAAMQNTQRLNPPVIKSMQAIMREMIIGEAVNCDFDELLMQTLEMNQPAMYVLTNKDRYFGATCMVYPDIVKRFAERREKDMYILPSSVHEVIIVDAEEDMDTDNLKAMIREVNQSQVAIEEQLSNSLYYYNRRDNILSVYSSKDMLREAVS